MGQLGAAVLNRLLGDLRWAWRKLRGRREARVLMGSEAVVDMAAAIKSLDPDVSQFSTMLMKVASAYSEGEDIGRDWKDPSLWDDWRWTSEWEERRREAVAHFEKQMRPSPVISWMEDTLFPRVGRVLRGDGQYLRAGDIVRVVAGGK